jgi:protein AroM
MVFKLAAVTVGQSPRDDIVPEIRAAIQGDIDITEFGVLDRLNGDEIADMAPIGSEPRLCTRLRNGSEVVTSKAKTGERLNLIMDELSGGGFDEIVLLCTGFFENVHCSQPFIESQRLVDGYVAAMAFGGRKIGVMVPMAEQVNEPKDHAGYACAAITHASPYSGDRLRQAGQQLADMDLIVMHCMGYSQPMRQTVMEASGTSVVLARSVIAAGINQLV